MKRIPLENVLAYTMGAGLVYVLMGAGLVYVFFVILDLIIDKSFSWFFFFGFWDIQMVIMLLIERIRSGK